MSIVLNANELTLNDLTNRFAIVRIKDPAFFSEWCTDLPPLIEMEQLLLDRVQQNFLDQLAARSIIEETVKMVVLSPLLDLAEFYRAPYGIESEVPIQVVIPSEDGRLQGRIDTLIVQHKLWIADRFWTHHQRQRIYVHQIRSNRRLPLRFIQRILAPKSRERSLHRRANFETTGQD